MDCNNSCWPSGHWTVKEELLGVWPLESLLRHTQWSCWLSGKDNCTMSSQQPITTPLFAPGREADGFDTTTAVNIRHLLWQYNFHKSWVSSNSWWLFDLVCMWLQLCGLQAPSGDTKALSGLIWVHVDSSTHSRKSSWLLLSMSLQNLTFTVDVLDRGFQP